MAGVTLCATVSRGVFGSGVRLPPLMLLSISLFSVGVLVDCWGDRGTALLTDDTADGALELVVAGAVCTAVAAVDVAGACSASDTPFSSWTCAAA